MSLTLPPAHSYQQFKLINGWECRWDPTEPVLNPAFDPENITPFHPELAVPLWSRIDASKIEALPYLFPGLRFITGACGTKFGKLELLSNLLPTPNGWRTMGDIHVGDYVFDESGRSTQVVYETPVHERKCYEVVFQDGAKIVVGAEHLWLTETHAARKAQARVKSTADRCKSTTLKAEVRDTEEIKRTLHVTMSGRRRPNHSVPVCGAAQYPAQQLSVDPYVLGAWLGDGTTGNGDVTGIDEEIFANIEKHYTKYQKPSCAVVGITWSFYGLRSDLKVLGVIDNKHVPEQYLIGSVEQRLALLQGLMDTDGTITKRGDCTFYNTNERIADAVYELVCSLGIKATRDTKQPKTNGSCHKKNGEVYPICHMVNFTTDLPVFRLGRKLSRIRPVALKAKRRYIVAVNAVPLAPAKCIMVASPTHLYLTGQSYIVTHNTFGCATAISKRAWNKPGSTNWWVAPSYDQAEMAMDEVKLRLPKELWREQVAKHRITLFNPDGSHRSVIQFKTAEDPDLLRGFPVDFFVMDEAARGMPYESFKSVMTTVTQTFGQGIIISTPNGRGWFYDIYQRGIKRLGMKEDNWPEWFSLRMPTWVNPHVPIQSILDAKKNLPADAFQQEYEARFLDNSAGAFRNIDGCVVPGGYEPYTPGHIYVMGVDLAKLRDFTVLTVMDRQRRKVVYWERFNQLDWTYQMSRIAQVSREYHALIYLDTTGIGDPIYDTLLAMGLNADGYKIGGSTAKQHLIENLRINIERGRISYPNISEMIDELERYQINRTEGGVTKYSAPEGFHDDTVISLALGVWVCAQDPWVYRFYNQRGI